ncbi:MAG: amidohydrolase family protein [Coriobacteriales bacterium]|jgi:5-methylthioadenosine/S-adenosylhomocysteine deaminase|nr:amidohydrolase family protein [Coriobacteriales bacterium]
MLLVARYVIPVSGPHTENGAVLVRGDRIIDVGPAARLKTRYPDETTTDFGLAALLPGFVDAHTHLEYSAMRGLINDAPYAAWKLHIAEKEKMFSAADWEDSALLGALEVVRSGITTVADITGTGASLKAALAVGLRGIIYREVGTMERREVDNVLEEACADIKQWRSLVGTQAGLRIGLAPAALYSCHPLVFEGVANYAADGTPVALHLAGSKEEYEFIRYGSSPFSVHSTEQERGYGIDMPPWLATGVSPVRYILNWGVFEAPNVLAIHCVQVDDSDIDKLVEYDINIAVCPRCNAQLAMGIAPVVKFFKAGLKVGLGTDSPAATDSTDPFTEMRTGLLLQRATGNRQDFLKANQMLRMATLGAAQALGLDGEIGSLEAGKAADIIAVDLSNSNQAPAHDPGEAVLYTASPDNIMMTMVGGKILYDGHHLHGVDVERVFARTEEMRIKLRN